MHAGRLYYPQVLPLICTAQFSFFQKIIEPGVHGVLYFYACYSQIGVISKWWVGTKFFVVVSKVTFAWPLVYLEVSLFCSVL